VEYLTKERPKQGGRGAAICVACTRAQLSKAFLILRMERAKGGNEEFLVKQEGRGGVKEKGVGNFVR